MAREIFANALLKDGKIMFWWTGSECQEPYDFYKDFYYAGLDMIDELATGKYSLEKKKISDFGAEEEEFYKQFPIHEESKGMKPYEVSV